MSEQIRLIMFYEIPIKLYNINGYVNNLWTQFIFSCQVPSSLIHGYLAMFQTHTGFGLKEMWRLSLLEQENLGAWTDTLVTNCKTASTKEESDRHRGRIRKVNRVLRSLCHWQSQGHHVPLRQKWLHQLQKKWWCVEYLDYIKYNYLLVFYVNSTHDFSDKQTFHISARTNHQIFKTKIIV